MKRDDRLYWLTAYVDSLYNLHDYLKRACEPDGACFDSVVCSYVSLVLGEAHQILED